MAIDRAAPAAPEFRRDWDRFTADVRRACERLGVWATTSYKPDAWGRGTMVFDGPPRLLVDKLWKMIDELRRIGWVVKLVRGLAPSITVDLRLPAPAPDA